MAQTPTRSTTDEGAERNHADAAPEGEPRPKRLKITVDAPHESESDGESEDSAQKRKEAAAGDDDDDDSSTAAAQADNEGSGNGNGGNEGSGDDRLLETMSDDDERGSDGGQASDYVSDYEMIGDSDCNVEVVESTKGKHPAEVEAEALNKELSKDAGISAGVHFIWERGREVCICVQLRRRIEGLTSGTVTALGLDPAKAVKVMLTTDENYRTSSKRPQVQWVRLVELDAKGNPKDKSIGETFPLARTIHEGLEDELSWVWPRLDGGDTLSASAALTANPGYLQLQRGYVGGSDSEVAPRAELKELAATNLLARLALTVIDRLRNAARGCVVCGCTAEGGVSPVPTVCSKPLCQYRSSFLWRRNNWDLKSPSAMMVFMFPKRYAKNAQRVVRGFLDRQRVRKLRADGRAKQLAKLEKQKAEYITRVFTAGGEVEVELQGANDGEVVRFLIDLCRRVMEGTRFELGFPTHIFGSQLGGRYCTRETHQDEERGFLFGSQLRVPCTRQISQDETKCAPPGFLGSWSKKSAARTATGLAQVAAAVGGTVAVSSVAARPAVARASGRWGASALPILEHRVSSGRTKCAMPGFPGSWPKMSAARTAAGLAQVEVAVGGTAATTSVEARPAVARSLGRICTAEIGAPCVVGAPDACKPNPCLNGGICEIDSAGGHRCTCSGDDYLGMHCQIETSGLDTFFIQVEFVGTWTEDRRAVFLAAADRWSEVIKRVPCGGNTDNPAGRNLITAELAAIDGPGNLLGYAGAGLVWDDCPTIGLTGDMRFDIADIANLELDGTFAEVILHEMGHVIGVGTLWEVDGYSCTTCYSNGDPEWTCPALIEEYNDLLGNPDGTKADVIETGGGGATQCGHLDEDMFGNELMTGFIVAAGNPLSKLTVASLEDIKYIVDPSRVDDYALPRSQIRAGEENGLRLTSVAVQTTIGLMGETGVVGETKGITIETYID